MINDTIETYTDTIKTTAVLLIFAALISALVLSRFELSKVREDLLNLSTAVEVQNNYAIEQKIKFQEVHDDLTKKVTDNNKLIAANRLLHAANKVSASPTPSSPNCTYGTAPTTNTETVELGFRDQAVDVALQLTYCQSFLTKNNFPIATKE